ncbi:WXG100 family type VII secretion target [Terrabacter terrigena]|uniref:WXG100 family type VII secretion target n=1 Tax=Terrabacter terrigena TaxID=574718 RepID=A0ABW3MXC0_9MICO
MFSKGADVDALRDSAGRMASFGDEVDLVRARGRRAVSTMQRVWQGPDLQHLVERWRRVEQDLVRLSADFDRLARRLNDNADLQHRSSGRPVDTSGQASGASGQVSRHASFGHVADPAGAGHGGRAGHQPAAWAAPVGASSVGSTWAPQAQTAMGWAEWIGVGQGFEPQDGVPVGWFHPVPSAAVGAAAAHRLGLPVR